MTARAFGLPPAAFRRVFPFHLVIHRDGTVLALGPALRRICPSLGPGSRIDQDIEIVRPLRVALDWRQFAHRPESVFLVRVSANGLHLRGQMLPIEGEDHVLFLATAEIADAAEAAEAERLGVSPGDFAVGGPALERTATTSRVG